jgi:hypothetical protein
VKNVRHFEFYNFILPKDATPSDGPMLLATDGYGVDFLDPRGLQNSQVTGVGFMGGGRVPQAGETFTLIQASNFHATLRNDGALLRGKKGAALLYDLRLRQAGNELTATIEGGPSLNPQMKALSEGFLGGAILALQGQDLIAGQGMRDAAKAASSALNGENGSGFAGFGSLSAGWSRYNTGTHIA